MDERKIFSFPGCEAGSRICGNRIHLLPSTIGGTRMNLRYLVELSQAERAELSSMLNGGKHAARKLKRAQILLAADAGNSDETIAAASRSAISPCSGPGAASWKATWKPG